MSGFCLQKKSGNVGLKGGEEGERGGSLVGVLWLGFFGWGFLVRLVHSENREELREFAKKREKNVGEGRR